MTNYRSLIGGFYSYPEDNKPVSIRCNNPGAVNGAAWERQMSGYVGERRWDGVNNTTIFETPEEGIAVYWTLLQKYRDQYGLKTVRGIITRYIGTAGARGYMATVKQYSGFGPDKVIDLDDDSILLPFAKAQFINESGWQKLPWSDEQIIYGFNLVRNPGLNKPRTETPGTTPDRLKSEETDQKSSGFILSIVLAILSYFRRKST